MQGYLGDPERTAEVIRDGWYVTGDIATIDESGFIRITDRLSRFSKIAGEMVPHMKVEEQIQALLEAQHTCVVTSVPDDARGERLVAFYTDPLVQPHELWERLCRTELPRLWLPKREDLRFVGGHPVARHGQGRPARGAPARGRRRRGGGVMIEFLLFLMVVALGMALRRAFVRIDELVRRGCVSFRLRGWRANHLAPRTRRQVAASGPRIVPLAPGPSAAAIFR